MAQVVSARAWCNNEVAYLAWRTDEEIKDCLGFMITRIHLADNGSEIERRILPAWAAFNTQSNPDWEEQDTSVWPIQKFSWRDLTLRRSRDTTEVRPEGFKVKYEIAPVGLAGPGRQPVPPSPTAQPGKYKGDPIPLFFCGEAGTTDPIAVTTDVVMRNGQPVISAGFTNGILSTQNLRKQLKVAAGKAPTKSQLEGHIDTDKADPIRDFLTADALPLISGFMARAAKEDLHLYCALYELNDPKLVALLKANAGRLHLILSTAGSTKPPKGSGQKPVWDGTNTSSRAELRKIAAEFHDRMFNNSAHIGHNKFVVLVDPRTDKAKALLAGSTNWTFTGLCTQTNNVIIIDDEAAAQAHYGYWKRLRDDKLPAPGTDSPTAAQLSAPNSNKQGAKLRSDNMTSNKMTIATDGGDAAVELWYSPNTQSATKGTATPPDLKVVFDLMDHAQQAIFFLTFMPSVHGDTSVIAQSVTAALAKPDLLVLGAISDGRALPDDSAPKGGKPARAKTSTTKKAKKSKKKKTVKKTKKKAKKKTAKKKKSKRTVAMAARASVKKSPKTAKSAKPAAKGAPPQPKPAIYVNPKAPKVLMVRAAAIGDFDLVGDWEHEMLKYGQAIIHDKIVVIDPLSDNCAVITGSHNLGYKASYANDENLLIVRGNKALAAAYAVHILDVYEHYKWRAVLEQQAFERSTGKGGDKPPVGKGILNPDGSWQKPYFDGSKGQDREYFLGAQEP